MKRDGRRRGPTGKATEMGARGSGRRRHAWAVLALWAVALAAYSNSFGGEIFADAAALLHDPRIAAPDVGALFRQQYWAGGTSGLYRPVATLSYVVNYALPGGGLQSGGYHALNFLLHAVNMLLVYALGFALFRGVRPALLLAAAWGLHPVLTESVTNIAGRPDLLAGFGVLAGLLAHVMARGTAGRRRLAWSIALAGAFAIGVFSKENAVILIALMALVDVTWRPRNWREVAPGYAAALIPLAAFLFAREQALSGAPPMHVLFTDNPLVGAGFWTSRLTSIGVLARYAGLLAWPAVLSCDYSFNAVPVFGWKFSSAGDWLTVAALGGLLAAAIVAVRSFRARREVWFFLAFFAVAIAPTSNLAIRIGTIMAERFLYLPAIAFAGFVVLGTDWLARRMGPRRERMVFAAAAALCCMFAVRTYARNADWLDERRMWESTVRAVPNNAKARVTLAQLLMDSGSLRQAVNESERAIAVVDGLPDELNTAADYATAGRAYRLLGESVAEPQRAAWYGKARQTLERARAIDIAASDAIRRRPEGRRYATLGNPDVYAESGLLYLDLREPRKAIPEFEQARRLRPGGPEDQDTAAIASAYYMQGAWRQAAVKLFEGQALDPANPIFAQQIYQLYKERDPQGCQVTGSGSGPALNLACPALKEDLCSALANVARLRRLRGEPALAERTTASARQQYGCEVK